MSLTGKQNQLKRILKQYVDVSNASNLEELSTAALNNVEDDNDLDITKLKIKLNLIEETMLYHSQDFEFLLKNKTNLNPNIQRLLDEFCTDVLGINA
jgi:hypothetical protein